MAKPSVTILFNLSANDVVCSAPTGDANFAVLDPLDSIAWRDSQQVDGDLTSGATYRCIIPAASSIEAPKTFVIDASEGEYVQVPLAGTTAGGQSGGDTRYVMCAFFDGPTATIPYLEAYDSNTHLTTAGRILGYGTAGNSLIKAICTTNGAPGSATWTGTALCGTSSRVALDTDALATSKYLYWNWKMLIPSTALSWSSSDWANTSIVFPIHYTYS